MKLEVGKTYKDRTGKEITITAIKDPNLRYPAEDKNGFRWTLYGYFYLDETDDRDLVEEVTTTFMKLEAGKKYRLRNGRELTVEHVYENLSLIYQVTGGGHSWTMHGEYSKGRVDDLDLVEEVEEVDEIILNPESLEEIEVEIDKLSTDGFSVVDVWDSVEAQKDFGKTLRDWGEDVHHLARLKGWWENVERSTLAAFANIHGEISEAWESFRIGNPKSEKIPEFTQIEEEMADVVIRVMDVCQANGWDLEKAIKAKHEFNKGRSFRHGGKKY